MKKRMLTRVLLLSLFSVVYQPSFAQAVMDKSQPLQEKQSINKMTNQTDHSQDYNVMMKQLTEQLTKEKAAFWGLTVEEWEKFEAINEKGGRGYWSPNLDPLTTLGVEAETKEEREHYARLLAKKEFERTEKELEFQRTYDRVFKEIYTDILPIEQDDNPNFVAPLNKQGERMALFVDINDPVRSIGLLKKALKAEKEMDIYLLNTNGDDNLIQQWAKKNELPVNQVRTGFLTLNHDKGQWNRIGKGIVPILLQEQNGSKFRQIELGD